MSHSDLEEEFSNEILNRRSPFFGELHDVLSTDGVVSLHVVGDARAVDSPSSNTHGERANRLLNRQAGVVSDLGDAGFGNAKQYLEVSTHD